eukprot:scaffold159049_cov27-Tisochrysis_lutea.AAC.4
MERSMKHGPSKDVFNTGSGSQSLDIAAGCHGPFVLLILILTLASRLSDVKKTAQNLHIHLHPIMHEMVYIWAN